MSTAAPVKEPAAQMSQNASFPGFNIDSPLWDPNTFTGRLKHFFWVTDPRTIVVPTRKLYDARKLVEDYRSAKLLHWIAVRMWHSVPFIGCCVCRKFSEQTVTVDLMKMELL